MVGNEVTALQTAVAAENLHYQISCDKRSKGPNVQKTMPSYVFQITEVREHHNVVETTDNNGHWTPSRVPGYNQPAAEGVTGTWWRCNGTQIWSVAQKELPNGLRLWKTHSVFFSGGYGFRVLRGDATNPPNDEVYHPLAFEHHDDDGCSSYLTNVMQHPTLRCHRADQAWTRMLLPNTYHGPLTDIQQYGGLKGELSIFLALLAFSMPAYQLPTYLPAMLRNVLGMTDNIGTHKRGVVVTIYTFSSRAGGSRAAELEQMEEGPGQRYYA